MLHRTIGNAELYCGDSAEILKFLAPSSIDACVTDPPYGLSFMGKAWDYDVPQNDLWRLVYEVLKPGAHFLSFFGSRTYHRGAVQIEDAGFDIRDQIMWLYGSGFPKSHDVSKAIDKAAGAERTIISEHPAYGIGGKVSFSGHAAGATCKIDAGAVTDQAKQWNGWGTALKPAHEPIVVARKPFKGTVVANVLTQGTGGLNIDACRIEAGHGDYSHPGNLTQRPMGHHAWAENSGTKVTQAPPHSGGRWPANVIHDGSDEAISGFPKTGGSKTSREARAYEPNNRNMVYGSGMGGGDHGGFADGGGSAARYFYCAKASRKDRDEGLEAHETSAPLHGSTNTGGGLSVSASCNPLANVHPTVKPSDLMRYLCRLVTPPGGVVLDPFMGSGSTGKAALAEGFHFIGIERDPKYFEIACARLAAFDMRVP